MPQYICFWLGEILVILWSFLSEIDECKDNPCKNGGTCVNSPPGSYTCNCAKSYKGDHCQEGTDKDWF